MPMIKRYSNRKLYDTESKRYIKLEDVAELIRRGQDVQVTDHATGADITALIQAQTILELEKRLKGGLPGVVLTTLIRAGNDTLHQLRGAFSPEDEQARVNTRIEERVQSLVQKGELDPAEGARLVDLLLSPTNPNDVPSETRRGRAAGNLLRRTGLPSHEDLAALVERLDRLNADIDQLSRDRKRPAARAKKSTRKRARRS